MALAGPGRERGELVGAQAGEHADWRAVIEPVEPARPAGERAIGDDDQRPGAGRPVDDVGVDVIVLSEAQAPPQAVAIGDDGKLGGVFRDAPEHRRAPEVGARVGVEDSPGIRACPFR
ncbi:hypothetical protein D9M69_529160 [compost metagenome]